MNKESYKTQRKGSDNAHVLKVSAVRGLVTKLTMAQSKRDKVSLYPKFLGCPSPSANKALRQLSHEKLTLNLALHQI